MSGCLGFIGGLGFGVWGLGPRFRVIPSLVKPDEARQHPGILGFRV